MNDNANNQPVETVRMGRIVAAIWANETETGTRHNFTVERIYRDKETEAWQSAKSFGREDALLLAKVLDQTHTRIHAIEQANREESSG